MEKENRNEPSTVNGILRRIEEKADTGEYIYRGEPEHYQEYPTPGKFLQISTAFFLNTRTLMLIRNISI